MTPDTLPLSPLWKYPQPKQLMFQSISTHLPVKKPIIFLNDKFSACKFSVVGKFNIHVCGMRDFTQIDVITPVSKKQI